jgi:hypothetical protein
MKTQITEKRKEKTDKLKIHFEILSLVFVLTLITVIMILSSYDNVARENEELSKEYVEVFKESELYEILEFSDTLSTKNDSSKLYNCGIAEI